MILFEIATCEMRCSRLQTQLQEMTKLNMSIAHEDINILYLIWYLKEETCIHVLQAIALHSILPNLQTAYHHICCWQIVRLRWMPLRLVVPALPKVMLRPAVPIRLWFDNECWTTRQEKHLSKWQTNERNKLMDNIKWEVLLSLSVIRGGHVFSCHELYRLKVKDNLWLDMPLKGNIMKEATLKEVGLHWKDLCEH